MANFRGIVTAGLLAFVAVSVVVFAVKEARRGERARAVATSDVSVGVDSTDTPERGVVVRLFHAAERCPSCLWLERVTLETMGEGFGEAVADGSLLFDAMNVEAPENEHLIDEYGLVGLAIVIEERVDGKTARWANLERAMESLWDEEAFARYLSEELGRFLEAE